jgi:hypothetical protein
MPDVRYEERKQDVINQEDKIAMLAYLFGFGLHEVLIIMIVTGVVVYLITRKRQKR